MTGGDWASNNALNAGCSFYICQRCFYTNHFNQDPVHSRISEARPACRSHAPALPEEEEIELEDSIDKQDGFRITWSMVGF